MAYDIVFLTNIPAFYKLRLYNRIAETKRILVLFLREGEDNRNEDFYKGERIFEAYTLPKGTQCYHARKIAEILRKIEYKELIIGGWDEFPYWVAALSSSKRKNSIVIESSVIESVTKGLKALLKRLFLSFISTAYCSGASNIKLIEKLGFSGKVKKTGGVGLYRRIEQPIYEERDQVSKYIYVGRLSPEKGLEFLIRVFNKISDKELHIIGFGPQETALKSIAKGNIFFHGTVKNEDLPAFYQKSDVFVLPSYSEPWGLVVEEALNNGLPVLLSDRVGCAEEFVCGKGTGLVFRSGDESDLLQKINILSDLQFYNSLRKTISTLDPKEREDAQIACYVAE